MFQNTRQLILKVTRGCNLACSYCYVFNKEKYATEVISDELYNSVIERWFSETMIGNHDSSSKNNDDALSLIFHGGEALTIGKKRMAMFAKIAKQKAREYNKNVDIGLQTNGTLIDEEWLALFTKFGINPGISFDGFGENMELRDPGSKHKVIEKILLMRAHGLRAGPLYVLSKNNYKSVVMDLKTFESMGIDSVKMNHVVDLSTEKSGGGVEMTADEWMEATRDILNYMWAGGYTKEQNLIDKMRHFVRQKSKGIEEDGDEQAAHCYTRYCGAGKNIIEIEPDGHVLFCGRNSKQSSFVSNGHIYTPDILELNNIRRQWHFQKHKVDSVIRNKCNLCHAQSICDGGCLAFSFQKFGDPKIDSATCRYHKELAKYFNLNAKLIKDYLTRIGEINESELSNKFSL